jgi:alpha-L-fucosidase
MKKKMMTAGLSLALCVLRVRAGAAQDVSPRGAWMKAARWGVMTHYLADWIAQASGHEMTVEEWNRLVDAFDAEGLAKQLESVGAGYYVITIGQNSGYYLAPNAAYDRRVKIRPTRCSRRDLVADLIGPLQKRGIRLIVYLPSGAPDRDPVAVQALGWRNGPYRNREFQLEWEQVVREWSTRWGKGVAGWWFDGCYWPNAMYRTPDAPNFSSFAAAARAGNPDAVVAFNPGVLYRSISVAPEEDYIAGEVDDPERYATRRVVDGNVDGAQLHVLSFLGATWGKGAPRFSTDQVVAWSTKVTEAGGAFTWDVPIQREGVISPPFLEQLAAVGRAVGGRRGIIRP